MVVNGITFGDICAYENADFNELPVEKQQIAPDHWRYRVDLTGLPSACGVALMVPDCFADINVVDPGQSAGLVRRSFLAVNWSLLAGVEDRELPELERATPV